tara:strand:+ start:3356 stop:3718 length:363 start_codon:yes stop_codon:yes gene_type:complete
MPNLLNSKKRNKWFDNNMFKIIIFILCVFYIYYFTTTFERTITIKKNINYMSGAGRSIHASNLISDVNNNVYRISNSLLLLRFNAAEMLSKFESGKTYKIRGYGIRYPVLGLYPNIMSIL